MEVLPGSARTPALIQGKAIMEPSPTLSKGHMTGGFIFLGVVLLLPWNCFLSAIHFWSVTFPDYNWPMYCTQVYQTTFLVVQLIMVKVGSNMSVFSRFHGPLIVGFLSTCALMVVATTVEPIGTRFVVCLLVSAVMAVAMGIMQSAVFGAAAQGIEKYGNLPAAVMLGMGIAGALAMVMSLLAELGGANAVFFVLFGAVLLMTLLGFSMVGAFKQAQAISESLADNSTVATDAEGQQETQEEWGALRSIRAAWSFELAIFLVFAVTFTVFPTICAPWAGSGPIPTGKDGWYTTLVFGTFQMMDNVGRAAAEFVPAFQALDNPKVMWALVLSRLVFIPLFVAAMDNTHSIFGTQWFQLLLMAVFATTNGLFGSLVLQFSPRHVPAEARGILGMAMTFFLVGGIAAGSYLALLLPGS